MGDGRSQTLFILLALNKQRWLPQQQESDFANNHMSLEEAPNSLGKTTAPADILLRP